MSAKPTTFISEEACAICDNRVDNVGLVLGKAKVVLCIDCSSTLVDLLLARFYPVWGQARFDADLERELTSLFDSIGPSSADAVEGVRMLRKLLDAQQVELWQLREVEQKNNLFNRCMRRGLALWKKKHEGRMWPDGAENICWLVEEIERLRKGCCVNHKGGEGAD